MGFSTSDTIVAVSSAPGSGDRGIVRLSGSEAVQIASLLFHGDEFCDLESIPGFTRLVGLIELKECGSVPAECYLFRGPASYTRQDLVELHTVGAAPLLAMIAEAAIARGARSAEAGEFTARAFLTGAMDLTEAEAVATVINARSDAELRAAQKLKEGRLAQRGAAVAEELTTLTSLVEADIDFSEEPIDFISPQEIRARLHVLVTGLRDLLDRTDAVERLSSIPSVMLVGPPNAGKSSLMNALTGLDRAICSAVAGTTRDVLSAPLALDGGEVRLLDSAGHDADPGLVSALARHRMIHVAQQVEAICLVVDLSSVQEERTDHLINAINRSIALVVANKVDLPSQRVCSEVIKKLSATYGCRVVSVSATEDIGLQDLRDELSALLFENTPIDDDVVLALTARHRGHLDQCCRAIQRAEFVASEAKNTIDCADLLAVDLREALDALGQLTGRVTTEDLLGRIFSSFCIGK